MRRYRRGKRICIEDQIEIILNRLNKLEKIVKNRDINISECNLKDEVKCSNCEGIIHPLDKFTDDDNEPLCIYCNDEFN